MDVFRSVHIPHGLPLVPLFPFLNCLFVLLFISRFRYHRLKSCSAKVVEDLEISRSETKGVLVMGN